MDENKIREKATEDWKKLAPTFGTNPYYVNGYIDGYNRALAELSSVLQANELLPHVSGSFACTCLDCGTKHNGYCPTCKPGK